MMDIALLTANANQLRFLITYNSETKTFYISTGLIVLSLIIQVLVGMGLIFKVSDDCIVMRLYHNGYLQLDDFARRETGFVCAHHIHLGTWDLGTWARGVGGR